MDISQLFSAVVGPENVLGPDRLAQRNPGYCAHSLDAGVLVRPENTQHLSQVCRLANEHDICLVPQGGLTGLVDGTASARGQVIVSLERMNRIIEIDPVQGTAEVEAGVTLQTLAQALEPDGLMFGVDIASRGSCMIGGMLATNAGGARVLKYGMMRDNTLGLEVVLADGRVLDLMNPLVKNNAGYDLKQMFIGSEGTLGIVTRVMLHLVPVPKSTATALLALKGGADLSSLVHDMRQALAGDLLSLEVMWQDYYRLTTSRSGYGALPLSDDHEVYVIVENAGHDREQAQQALLGTLETAFECNLIADAVVAQSETERQKIWRSREDSDAVEQGYEANLSYDIGLKLDHLDSFVIQLKAAFQDQFPNIPVYVFGHAGDGNLHVMCGLSHEQFALRSHYDRLIYDTLARYPGSTISAEHGIGLEKREELALRVSEDKLEAMRQLKQAFDPKAILNPGKIFTC